MRDAIEELRLNNNNMLERFKNFADEIGDLKLGRHDLEEQIKSQKTIISARNEKIDELQAKIKQMNEVIKSGGQATAIELSEDEIEQQAAQEEEGDRSSIETPIEPEPKPEPTLKKGGKKT